MVTGRLSYSVVVQDALHCAVDGYRQASRSRRHPGGTTDTAVNSADAAGRYSVGGCAVVRARRSGSPRQL